uniref:Uncharacterized protein n=1 Tax=Arundo donax TaxID=35708 RepID=A0A0A9EN82_ARUDO
MNYSCLAHFKLDSRSARITTDPISSELVTLSLSLLSIEPSLIRASKFFRPYMVSLIKHPSIEIALILRTKWIRWPPTEKAARPVS